jgi:hypothetical protein
VLSFTVTQFYAVFARYNASVWPAWIVAYGLGVAAVVGARHGSRGGNILAGAVLALFWGWTGIAYHWLFFAAINKAAWLFGALFVAEALLFASFGLRLQFGFVARPRRRLGFALNPARRRVSRDRDRLPASWQSQ